MSSSESAKRPRRRWLRRGLRWVEHVLAAIGVLFLIYHVCFDLSVMCSYSMAPTLKGTAPENGDWILTEKVSYWFRAPRRWEIVTFRNPDGMQVMKRVAGLPGENVALRDGRVEIDGAVVAHPASLDGIKYLAYGKLFRGRCAPCDDGYFVLGDFSKDSQDSRFDGPLPREKILGRAWLVVWPPSRARPVGP
jgi:signal peptidase I